MQTVAYRSFVIRVWSRQGSTARALLEDIQSGARSELRGERAERLVAVLNDSLPPTPEGEADASRVAIPVLEQVGVSERAPEGGHDEEVW